MLTAQGMDTGKQNIESREKIDNQKGKEGERLF